MFINSLIFYPSLTISICRTTSPLPDPSRPMFGHDTPSLLLHFILFIYSSPLFVFFWYLQFLTLHLSSILSPLLSTHLLFLLSFSNFLWFLTDVVDFLSNGLFLWYFHWIFPLNLRTSSLWLFPYFLLTFSWLSSDFFLTFFWLFPDFLLTFSWLPSDFFLISFCIFLFYLITFFPACQHKWYRRSSFHLYHVPDHFCDQRWGVSGWLPWF